MRILNNYVIVCMCYSFFLHGASWSYDLMFDFYVSVYFPFASGFVANISNMNPIHFGRDS